MLDCCPPEAAARVRYIMSTSHIQLGRPHSARDDLDAAKEFYAANGPAERLVECMASEAGCAILTEAPGAIEACRRALAACRELNPPVPPLEVRILNSLAAASIAAGAWHDAIDAYEQAIKVAGPLYDMRRRGRLFSDAALAYKEIGRFETAIRFISQSVALLEATRELVMLARAENNFGVILMAMGDTAQARPHLERSLALCVQTGLETGRPHVLMSLAELCLTEGRVETARLFAQQALELAQRNREVASSAEAHLWLGRIAAAAGDVETCDREFAFAIEQLHAAGGAEWTARCHEAYAEVLEKRGDIARANAELKIALGCRARPSASVPPIA